MTEDQQDRLCVERCLHGEAEAFEEILDRYESQGPVLHDDGVPPEYGQAAGETSMTAYLFGLLVGVLVSLFQALTSVQEQTLDQLEIPASELSRLRQLLTCRDGIIIVPKGAHVTRGL